MLINLRNALMSGKRLPYDAEVEYLESTGTQWIDTGKFPNNVGRWELTIQFTSLTPIGNNDMVNGAFGALNQRFDIGWRNSTNSWQLNIGTVNSMGTRDTNVHTFVLDNINGSVSVDNQSTSVSTVRFSATIYPILIANRKYYASDANYFCMEKIYSSKMYDYDGNLVRDFIPVRKGTVGYLYDRVSGKLFGNAGTGDFVLGQDVVPVEYIESHGTEYIDTGVVATNSHGFRVDVATAQKSGAINTRIFGVHEDNVRCGFALYGKDESGGNDFFWGWNAATGFVADIPQRFVVSLNYKNDRAAIFNGTTNLSQLGTLGGITQSVYLLNANYGNAPFANQFVVGKFYGAEITVGSDVANHYLPVRVGTEGAMMDVLTRRIYRNAGTGAFTYGNDLKYPIPAE